MQVYESRHNRKWYWNSNFGETQLKLKLMVKIGGHPTPISANIEDLLHTWRERLCDFMQISRLDHQGIFQKSFSLNLKTVGK